MIMEFGKKKIFGKVFYRKYSIKSSKKLCKRKKTNHSKNRIMLVTKKVEMTIKSSPAASWATSTILANRSKSAPYLAVTSLIDLIEQLPRVKRRRRRKRCVYQRSWPRT